MLVVNGKPLNLTDPKSDQERRVAKELAQLVEDYKLAEGGTVSIVYPKEYIKINKFNPSRPFRPASLKISFRDVVRNATGTEDWRWAEREDNGKNNIGKVYSPSSKIFTGSWQLGLAQSDLLYFLLKISSRMEGGANAAEGKRPYMVIENKVKDATEFGNKEVEAAYISMNLFKEMSEEKVREFAKLIGVDSIGEQSILRKTVHSILSKDKFAYKKLSEFLGVKKTDPDADTIKEAMTLAFKAISSGVLELRGKDYVFAIDGELKDQPLFGTGNKPEKEKALAVFLSKNQKEFELLSSLCVE